MTHFTAIANVYIDGIEVSFEDFSVELKAIDATHNEVNSTCFCLCNKRYGSSPVQR